MNKYFYVFLSGASPRLFYFSLSAPICLGIHTLFAVASIDDSAILWGRDLRINSCCCDMFLVLCRTPFMLWTCFFHVLLHVS